MALVRWKSRHLVCREYLRALLMLCRPYRFATSASNHPLVDTYGSISSAELYFESMLESIFANIGKGVFGTLLQGYLR